MGPHPSARPRPRRRRRDPRHLVLCGASLLLVAGTPPASVCCADANSSGGTSRHDVRTDGTDRDWRRGIGRRADDGRRRRLRGRRAMYLPPAPVTPFRGGLKSVADDDDDDDNGDDGSDATEAVPAMEAPSSDRGPDHRPQSDASSNESSNAASPWAPGDYPDPWTDPILCGGSAAAAWTTPPPGGPPPIAGGGRRGPLFCDPDRVLDEEALRAVALKLRAFAEAFAASEVVQEGVGFGTDGTEGEGRAPGERVEQEEESNPSSGDQAAQSPDEAVVQGVEFGGRTGHDLPGEKDYSSDGVAETSDPTVDEMQQQQAPEIVSSDGAGYQKRSIDAPTGHRRLPFPDDALWSHHPETRLYSDSVGGLFSATRREQRTQPKAPAEQPPIEIAVALVQKINLPAILRADSYFFYSDQDDMVNDAAQYFARYIHDTWSKRLAEEQRARDDGTTAASSSPTNLVLIFISTQDRICYISSGTRIAAVLPWWRLEHVVQDMKMDLRKGRTGEALTVAIEDLTALLLEGPPSFGDRVNDFFGRFGIVMLFTIFTFAFASWGECRDRRKRFFFAERRSRMTASERERARQLQKEFKTKACPICLEPFDLTPAHKDTESEDGALEGKSTDKEQPSAKRKQRMKRVDSLGIPTIGTDDEPIKLLRCGHIFDKTCWSMWVDSGQGNPWICPVCRQDVGRPKRSSASQTGAATSAEARVREEADRPTPEDSSLFARIVATTTGPSMLLRPVTRSHPNYNSLQPRRSQRANVPFAALSHPNLRRLHPMLGVSMAPPMEEGMGEHTPLFAQESGTSNEGDDDY